MPGFFNADAYAPNASPENKLKFNSGQLNTDQLRATVGLPPLEHQTNSLIGELSDNVSEIGGAALKGWGPAIGGLVAGPAGLGVGEAAGGGATGAIAQGAAGGAIGAGVSGGNIIAGAEQGGVTGGATSGFAGGGDVLTSEDAAMGGAMSSSATSQGVDLGNPIAGTGLLWQGNTFTGSGAAVPFGAPGDASAFGPAASTGGGTSFLSTASPTETLTPEMATFLGITPSIGDLPIDASLTAGLSQSSFGTVSGGAPENMGAFGGINDNYVGDFGTDQNAGAAGDPTSYLDETTKLLKKLGLTPVQAGLLGLTGYNMSRKTKIPEAGQKLSDSGTAGSADARGVISSGGTSAPQWSQQKASIDATIDQQIKEQSAAMLQQAVNSGVGADSQVTLQQINKLKNDLETKRQQLYAQSQSNNVGAALQELGISDAALANVTRAQFESDAQARQMAMTTAELAMLLGSRGG